MGYYDTRIRSLLESPESFAADPGYKFAVDQGMQGALRSNSKMRSSGNVLAELSRLGSGYASQQVGDTIDRYGRLSGQEQQYDLGMQQNNNTRRIGDQNFGLGMGRLEADRWQNQANYDLGRQSNATNWFNAVTNRGTAQSQDYNNTQRTNQNWYDRFF